MQDKRWDVAGLIKKTTELIDGLQGMRCSCEGRPEAIFKIVRAQELSGKLQMMLIAINRFDSGQYDKQTLQSVWEGFGLEVKV